MKKAEKHDCAEIIRAAVESRDIEWWSALAGVDTIGPNPQDVKRWVLLMQLEVEDAAFEGAARAGRAALWDDNDSHTQTDVEIAERKIRSLRSKHGVL